MTIRELINTLGDIAGRFDISEEEAVRIAKAAIMSEDPENEFVRIWENTDFWTDENNA